MEQQALWIVAIIGTGTLVGTFLKMKGGFGPMNLRIIGIVLIAVLVALLAIARSDTLNAAMGILGAIAGYLFGANAENGDEKNDSKVEAKGASFGDNSKVAGRDINETVNNINAKVKELSNVLSQTTAKMDHLIAEQDSQFTSMEFLINTVYQRDIKSIGAAIQTVIAHWAADGWTFKGMSSDFQGMDGIFLLFERPSVDNDSNVHIYHSSNFSEV